MVDAETLVAKAAYDAFMKEQAASGLGCDGIPLAYTVKSGEEILYWGFDLDEAMRVAKETNPHWPMQAEVR